MKVRAGSATGGMHSTRGSGWGIELDEDQMVQQRLLKFRLVFARLLDYSYQEIKQCMRLSTTADGSIRSARRTL